MFKILLSLTCFLASQMSFAEWKHASAISAEGVQIQVNYEVKQGPVNCFKCSQYTYATPLWITIEHSSLKSSDKVRVMLLNFRKHSFYSKEQLEVQELDLKFFSEDSSFSQEAQPLVIYSSGYGGTEICRQEIAVVINGQWLKNPVNGTSNFAIKL